MIQQYLSIKKNYEDAFLFFRLGDFYEMFFEDAKLAVKELEITLTSRDGGDKERIPMCGVPYHSADHYIQRLIEKGYKVAICEQVEDPKEAKGVVKREVIQVITPGTVMNESSLQPKQNNFIAAISMQSNRTFSLAVVDMTTGEAKATANLNERQVIQEILAFECREIVMSTTMDEPFVQTLKQQAFFALSYEDQEEVPASLGNLLAHSTEPAIQRTFGKLLNYLNRTQKRSLDHLQPLEVYAVHETMRLNEQSRRNLELVATIRGNHKKGSLLWLLDHTMTAMGGRRLKTWIEKPLINEAAILERSSVVETFITHFFERETLREKLKEIYDLERLVGRISFGNVNARELIQLKQSLAQIPEVKEILRSMNQQTLKDLVKDIDPCEDIHTLVNQAIIEDPPISITEGGMIKDGYNQTLDDYRYVSRNGKTWLAELEKSERVATGIKSLKIGYNKVFGYYIEVTKANLKFLPEGRYERKQTLTNAERYVTPELKEKEKMILEAEEKTVDLEYELFQEVRKKIKAHGERLQKLARIISNIDVLQSLATVSDENNYVKPHFSHARTIHLTNSRHPVVEKVLPSGTFVANDLSMDTSCDVLLITGPNMGGKSTAMRQVALSAIMAQMGCFVPADEAVLPIFDQIFTRIGAADDLVSGQSTFMVEMAEAKEAITEATDQSLILLDEIGRGTSTYDGIAIARAIVEYIHSQVKAKTLFSTHYHELTALEQVLERLRNVHVGAIEEEGKVVFSHKVLEGAADKSYGIHVAELAELPHEVITRANVILADLEGGVMAANGGQPVGSDPQNADPIIHETSVVPDQEKTSTEQLTFFVAPSEPSEEKQDKLTKKEKEVLKDLKAIDLLAMTPMEAMNQLYTIQTKLKSKSHQ
ncbi:DNA mismatch repair protein MutS [Pullulanibacillus pueri]|nr:DNA mismatch repair protein MutS [Pullulanibacillus pueri]